MDVQNSLFGTIMLGQALPILKTGMASKDENQAAKIIEKSEQLVKEKAGV